MVSGEHATHDTLETVSGTCNVDKQMGHAWDSPPVDCAAEAMLVRNS